VTTWNIPPSSHTEHLQSFPTSFLSFVHESSSRMIILDGEADRQAKLDSFSGPTIRHPERASTRSFSPLPDYDTSEAQHRSFTKPPSTHIFDSKFWRAVLYALVVYIILSAVIGIPLVVLVRIHLSFSTSHDVIAPPRNPKARRINGPQGPQAHYGLSTISIRHHLCNFSVLRA